MYKCLKSSLMNIQCIGECECQSITSHYIFIVLRYKPKPKNMCENEFKHEHNHKHMHKNQHINKHKLKHKRKKKRK